MPLAQQPRDRVELLGGRSQRECAHRRVGCRAAAAGERCATTPTAPMRCVTWRTSSFCQAVPRWATPSTDTPAQARRETGEVLGRGAAEGSRPDVRVAEREHRDTPVDARLEQLHAAEGELLRIVHEDDRSAAERRRARRCGAQHSDSLADEPRGVAVRTAHVGAHLEVLREERGHRLPHRDGRERAAAPRSRSGSMPERRALGQERPHLRAEALRASGCPDRATPASDRAPRPRPRRRPRGGPG